MTGARPLTDDEAALLNRLLRADFDGVEALRAQVPSTIVTGPWSPGSASLNLSVSPGSPPSIAPNGPIPGSAWTFAPSGEPVGTLLLWVGDGYLTAIEYGWVTDEPPTALPGADAVRDVD